MISTIQVREIIRSTGDKPTLAEAFLAQFDVAAFSSLDRDDRFVSKEYVRARSTSSLPEGIFPSDFAEFWQQVYARIEAAELKEELNRQRIAELSKPRAAPAITSATAEQTMTWIVNKSSSRPAPKRV